MACRCVCRIYHPRSRSSEVCSLDKPLASLGVYLGCKLPLTSTSGGIFGIHTSKPWFIYYLYTLMFSYHTSCKPPQIILWMTTCIVYQLSFSYKAASGRLQSLDWNSGMEQMTFQKFYVKMSKIFM